MLLLIDMQQGELDVARLPPIDGADGLVEHAEVLLAAARRSQTPVFYVQHCNEAGQAFEQGTLHWLIVERLTPTPGVAEDARRTWPTEGRVAQHISDQVNRNLRALAAMPCSKQQFVERLAAPVAPAA